MVFVSEFFFGLGVCEIASLGAHAVATRSDFVRFEKLSEKGEFRLEKFFGIRFSFGEEIVGGKDDGDSPPKV